MNLELGDSCMRRKDKGNFIYRMYKSFFHGLDGIIYSIEVEKNMLCLMIYCILLLVIGLVLRVSNIELCILLITVSTLFASELINNSIEALSDLITLEDNKLIKIAKDCTNGSTLLLIVSSIIISLIIFVPKII